MIQLCLSPPKPGCVPCITGESSPAVVEGLGRRDQKKASPLFWESWSHKPRISGAAPSGWSAAKSQSLPALPAAPPGSAIAACLAVVQLQRGSFLPKRQPEECGPRVRGRKWGFQSCCSPGNDIPLCLHCLIFYLFLKPSTTSPWQRCGPTRTFSSHKHFTIEWGEKSKLCSLEGEHDYMGSSCDCMPGHSFPQDPLHLLHFLFFGNTKGGT